MTTQTFLLTDVEASTRLWEQDWDAMASAMAHHERVVTEAVVHHDGSLLKSRGEGDSAFAVFDSAPDAIAAAVDVQRAFQLAPWPSGIALNVRAAVHTGHALDVGGDLVGPEVNRCARLRALAHGGQTLISGASAAAELPADVVLRDLGTYVLRDLTVPEHVFQLCHRDLRDDFPPLRAPHPTIAHLSAIVDEVTVGLTRLPAGSPALGLSGRIELADARERAAFVEEIKELFEPLARRYAIRGEGAGYRIAFACYPEVAS